MGCGCNKAKSSVVPAGASAARDSVVKFDVVNGEGSIVASYESVVLARSEARRVGGNVVPTTSTAGGTAEVPVMSVPVGEQAN